MIGLQVPVTQYDMSIYLRHSPCMRSVSQLLLMWSATSLGSGMECSSVEQSAAARKVAPRRIKPVTTNVHMRPTSTTTVFYSFNETGEDDPAQLHAARRRGLANTGLSEWANEPTAHLGPVESLHLLRPHDVLLPDEPPAAGKSQLSNSNRCGPEFHLPTVPSPMDHYSRLTAGLPLAPWIPALRQENKPNFVGFYQRAPAVFAQMSLTPSQSAMGCMHRSPTVQGHHLQRLLRQQTGNSHQSSNASASNVRRPSGIDLPLDFTAAPPASPASLAASPPSSLTNQRRTEHRSIHRSSSSAQSSQWISSYPRRAKLKSRVYY